MNKQTNKEEKQEPQLQTEQLNSETSPPNVRYVDHWIVLKFVTKQEVFYRLLSAKDHGDFEKWRLNSGILSIRMHSDSVDFFGHSGSIYRCNFRDERLTLNMALNLEQWKKSSARQCDSLVTIGFRSFLQDWTMRNQVMR